jgi:hypothetical protein
MLEIIYIKDRYVFITSQLCTVCISENTMLEIFKTEFYSSVFSKSCRGDPIKRIHKTSLKYPGGNFIFQKSGLKPPTSFGKDPTVRRRRSKPLNPSTLVGGGSVGSLYLLKQ